MENIIIGTAGHIDHGKTSIIKALSGYEGDSTKEEKQRGITIDLSFSNLKNDEKNISFIDVPGHKNLIKTMICGAFSFDAVMFIVDVNEGLMPQSLEHLEILNFLGVSQCLVVLSKVDLADENIIKNQIMQVKNAFKNYHNLNLIDILKTSIHDEKSIQNLQEKLFNIKEIDKENNGVFRYFCDRVFSLKGIGIITTGTLISGQIFVNEKVFIYESKKEAIVRNIQTHNQSIESANKKQRVALNLNTTNNFIKKGFMISKKGYFRGFYEIEGYVKCFLDEKITHNLEVLFLLSSKQVNAKIFIIKQISANEAFIKVKFKEEIFACFEDKFVLLFNNKIYAGGIVLNPIIDRLKKSIKVSLLEALHEKNLKQAFLILANAHKKGFGLLSSYQRFCLDYEEALLIAQDIDIFIDEHDKVLYPKEVFADVKNIILSILKKNQNALISPNSINNKTSWISNKLATKILNDLINEKTLVFENGIYFSSQRDISQIKSNLKKEIYEKIISYNFTPPAPYHIYDEFEIDRSEGDKIFKDLSNNKQITRLAHNLFISTNALDIMIENLKQMIKKDGKINVQSVKNKFNFSRKYALCFLEHLDKDKNIKNENNQRMFKT